MFYPEDDKKTNWDLFITIILIFTCISTPYLISFEGDSAFWRLLNIIIDSFFIIDIVFSFNTAYYDEDFVCIDSRKIIACKYMQSWFLVDIVAIIPFDLIFGANSSGGANGSYN